MSESLSKHLFLWMLVFVVLVFVVNLCLPLFGFDANERGTFGDQFGAANALFSGLAFVGLIYTIILQRKDLALQRKDLRLQRDELALTRSELERQTQQFEEQNKTLRVQRFENTFFQMLSQFQDVVNNLSYSYQEGRDVVSSLPHFEVYQRTAVCRFI